MSTRQLLKKLKPMGIFMIPGGLALLATGILLGFREEVPQLEFRIAILCVGAFNCMLGCFILLGCRRLDS